MLALNITEERIFFGDRFSVSFQRTLRVPESYRVSKLPPGFGPLPIRRVADYANRVPDRWHSDAVFIPLDAREAMWLSFNAASWKPNAVKIGVGEVNAVSGGPWSAGLSDDPQDYVVCPLQLWLDGINAGDNFIRQFVAAPLGQGYTVESQASGVEKGGMRIVVLDPKKGIFPDEPPPRQSKAGGVMHSLDASAMGEFGLAAGGKIEQRIYPDPYGIDTWDAGTARELFVYLISRELYAEITGQEAAPSPVSARTYTEQELGPWFELMDQSLGDVPAPENLSQVHSMGELEQGRPAPDEETHLDEKQVTRIRHHDEKDE